MKLRDGKILVNFWLNKEDFEAAEKLREILHMRRSDFWRFLLKEMRLKMGKLGL
jgi:hypothetical protein